MIRRQKERRGKQCLTSGTADAPWREAKVSREQVRVRIREDSPGDH